MLKSAGDSGARVRALARFLAVAVGCAASVWLLALVAPRVAIDSRLAFALAFAAVTFEILALALYVAPLPPALTIGSALLAALPLYFLIGAPATGPYAALLTLVLGVAATLLGAGLGARIERPGQLAAVAIVSAIADLWSVFDPGAPSARLAAQVMARPDELALAALPFPLLGTALVPALIGAGDVVFVALYVAAFRAHGLATGKLVAALALAFGVGLFGLLASERPLPLLPLLGAAVLMCDPAARSLRPREWRTVLLVAAVLISAIALRIAR